MVRSAFAVILQSAAHFMLLILSGRKLGSHMDESITSVSSIRPVTGDQNRDGTLLSDPHIASRRTPYRNIPISLTWPLIITLVGCGGGARPTTHIPGLADDLEGIPDGIVADPNAVQPVVDGREGGAPPNLGPSGNFDIPNFADGDADSEHNALHVGQEFSYTLPADTFIDPEGDPITYSLTSGSTLPPGIAFDPVTRTLSGTMEDFRTTNPNGSPYHISFVGTDPQGLSATHDVYLAVIMPNRIPVRKEAELVDQVFEVNDPVTIDMRKYFRDPDGDRMIFTADGLPAGMTM